MRIAFICVAVVVAGMAMMASATSAQTIEVVQEDNNNLHCSSVPNSTTGGCVRGGTGEVSLTGHVFGIEATASDCNVAFEGRVDEDGEGYVYSASYTGDASHNCTRTPCGLPWRAHGEEVSGSTAIVTLEFCAHPTSGSDNRCQVSGPVSDQGDHAYVGPLTDAAGTTHLGADCELTSGSISGVTDASHPALEVIHTP
jgi:hypothetical protein